VPDWPGSKAATRRYVDRGPTKNNRATRLHDVCNRLLEREQKQREKKNVKLGDGPGHQNQAVHGVQERRMKTGKREEGENRRKNGPKREMKKEKGKTGISNLQGTSKTLREPLSREGGGGANEKKNLKGEKPGKTGKNKSGNALGGGGKTYKCT